MTALLRLATACVCITLLLIGGVASSANAAVAYERLLNGTFDSVKTPWWSSANTPSRVESGKLCADIPAGTVNPWNSMIGQDDVPVEAGQPYTLRFTATATKNVTIRAVVQLQASPFTTVMNKSAAVTPTPKSFVFTGTSTVTNSRGQMSFQMGGATEAYTLCVDDVSLTGGVIPPGGIRDLGSPVRVNQHGYLASGPKRATIVNAATAPLPWRLLDAAGSAVATGSTQVYGADAMSGDYVHIADFSTFATAGSGYSLAVGTDVSLPFDIGDGIYSTLRKDALAYFYHNRSGIPIEAQYVGTAYARPAGHVGVAPNQGDISVPCLPGTCDYSLNVRGGWYDAGDHGKYVVNGALAAWQLMDLYERSQPHGDTEGVRDGLLRIPETGNGVADVLDEARWEMEFLLEMQVPAGKPLAGMAHHKIHDELWTGLPLLPSNDPQARYLYPPSTAATLNLAATAAQCARIWATVDPAFAARCLTAAETAWQAARGHPDLYAPSGGVGGGAYADTNVTDEFSWAATELYATTRNASYLPFITTQVTADGFSWQATGALADLTITRLPGRFTSRQFVDARKRVIAAADGFLHDEYAQGYANPYLPTDGQYAWGSNSSTLNNAVIMATAYDITGDNSYRAAVLESMDYLLGRNALNQSYISGYGERASHNEHHRFWAHQLDPNLPNPPAGAIAGGPNSGIQDPVAQRNLPGCAPAKCYLDEIGAWSTNEVAINWNSALAWVAGFADSPTHPADYVDETPPYVAGTPDRPANEHGWYNAPVTVTWSSVDPAPSSGTANIPAPASIATDGADQVVTADPSCDLAGNCTTGRYPVSIDTTAPTIAYSVSAPANSNGWHNTDVTVTFTCADALSGIASCPAPMTVTTVGANQAVTGTAIDNAGNTAAVTATLNLDQVAPTITASLSQAANGAGWNNSDVTVTFTCADAVSGVDFCTTPVTLTGDGPNQVVTGTAIDRAGNATVVTVTVSIDKTKPLITGVRTDANSNGWNNSDVTVTFSCTDALSGIATCPAPVTLSTQGAGQSTSGTAVSQSGSSATTAVTGINIDKTPPAIAATVTGTKNSAGWYTTTPVIHYTCADTLSGIATCPEDITVTTDGANQSITATAIDNAGNTTDVTVTGLDVDRTAPALTIAGAINGATYPLDHLPAVSCTTSDATSGVAIAATASTSRTASGLYTVTCTGATDVAGNTAPSTVITYTLTPTTTSLAALTSQNVSGSGTPVGNGVIQDLRNKLLHGQICHYITKVNNETSGEHPTLTASQAAELTYWARILDPCS